MAGTSKQSTEPDRKPVTDPFDLDAELPEVKQAETKAETPSNNGTGTDAPKRKRTTARKAKTAPKPRPENQVKSVNIPQPAAVLERQAEQTEDALGILGETNAAILLTLLDGIAAIVLGEGARMTQAERDLIEEPLKRIFNKFGAASLDVINKWSDPVTVVFGLVLWVNRISRLNKPAPIEDEGIKGQEAGEVTKVAQEPAQEPAPQNITLDNAVLEKMLGSTI